jgi:hypothetical protein
MDQAPVGRPVFPAKQVRQRKRYGRVSSPNQESTAMTSGSIKNPEEEAEHPAPMPKAQQGQGHTPRPRDPEGQQGGQQKDQHTEKPHAKMAVHSDSPPGIELDGQAHVIPLDQRTESDRRKALERKKPK